MHTGPLSNQLLPVPTHYRGFRHPPFVKYSFNCSLSTHFEWTRWPHFILSTRWYPVDFFFFKEHNSLLWIISRVWYHMVLYLSWFRMIVKKYIGFSELISLTTQDVFCLLIDPFIFFIFLSCFLNTVFRLGPRSIFPRSTAVSCCYAGLRGRGSPLPVSAFFSLGVLEKPPVLRN